MKRPVTAWALYDWANSAFATVVMAGFFPIFLRDYWAAGSESQSVTFFLGLANSLSSLMIMLVAPYLGAVADQGSLKKRFLVQFAFLGILMTAGLFWLAQGQWQLAVAFYALASFGFMGANVFYDSLLVDVAEPRRYERASAFGFALGYLGGGLLFAFCVSMTLMPQVFGLADEGQAVRVSFLLTAAWWAVFSIPLLLFVRESRRAAPEGTARVARAGFRQLWQTFRDIRQLRHVGLFLVAYWLYIDGVDTVIRMAVDYGRAIGFDTNGLITALLVTQFVGFPAAILYGRLGERIGARRGIYIGLGVYVLVTVWAARMESVWEFYALATIIGLVQGGIQALSRAFYARLIPADKSAEFFGFYNVLGKFAAVIGPVMVGWVGLLADSPRAGILSLLVLFASGALLLYLVPERSVGASSREACDRRG